MAAASAIKVRLPAAFRGAAGGRSEVRVSGGSVGEVLAALRRAYPELAGKLLAADGTPRRYVSLFVNDEDIRQLGGVDAAMRDGDELTIVPALSGGEGRAEPLEQRAAMARVPGDGSLGALERAAVAAIAQLAERSPNAEVCGFVLRSSDGATLEVLAARNAAREPARAFEVYPLDTAHVLRLADDERRAVVALYHSHPNGGSVLSAADTAQLTAAGAPILAGVELWVIGLDGGRATELRAYAWTERGFSERMRCEGPFTPCECPSGTAKA